VLAHHDLAVVEFQRISTARLCDAVNGGALGEFRENGVEIRVSEIADVGHLDTEGGQRVGHDRAIPAELHAFNDHLGVHAFARGGADARAECRERGHAGEFLRGFALVHHADDFVNEAVEADSDAVSSNGRGLRTQGARGALWKRFGIQSKFLTNGATSLTLQPKCLTHVGAVSSKK